MYFDDNKPYDTKLSNGLNITENKLYEAMLKIGLEPIPQYQISKMVVDFAFPDERLVIEINGPHHKEASYLRRDKRRYFILNKRGWKRQTYNAEVVYNNPDRVAKQIAERLNYSGHSNATFTYDNEPTNAQRSPNSKKAFIFSLVAVFFFWIPFVVFAIIPSIIFTSMAMKRNEPLRMRALMVCIICSLISISLFLVLTTLLNPFA